MKPFRKILKFISVQVLFTLLFELGCPLVAKALTSGPTQPEMAAFEPAGTSDMVDISTGAFNYNIPLLDIEGYPITLSYHGGVSMDQEASWVGLGWNINPGAINREMRGIPDDFKGDLMTREMNVAGNRTAGLEAGIGAELFGDDEAFGGSLNVGVGFAENNYTGTSFDLSLNPSVRIGQKNSTHLNAGIGLDFSSQNGFEVSPNVGLDAFLVKNSNDDLGLSVNASFNSRQGLKQLAFGSSATTKYFDPRSSFSIPVGTPTYIPEYNLPMTTSGLTIHNNIGYEVDGIQGYLYGKSYQTQQSLNTNTMLIPAYGYMYSEFGQNDDQVIMDFNRERDQTFSQYMQQLPVTNQTYDIYSVTGQGISGEIRAHRSDVGIVHDNKVTSNSENVSAGYEVGPGNVIKVGLNLGNATVNSTSGNWTGGAGAGISYMMNFKGADDISDPSFEPVFFKMGGELTTGDKRIYNQFNNTSAARIALTSTVSNPFSTAFLVPADHPTDIPLSSGNTYLHYRDKRNSSIRILDAADATTSAYERSIQIYPSNYWVKAKSNSAPPDVIGRIDPDTLVRKKHHVSEITITKSDGSKYVYGIPVYNLSQKDASFAVADHSLSYNSSNNVTTYFVDTTTFGINTGDNSIYNQENHDNYFSSNALPPFAHAYMLTAVLSPDYQDLKGDGITDDDFGSATRFHYTRIYQKGGKEFRWRAPYKAATANYNQGLQTKSVDQRASYSYGTKEVWYMQSIESKNYVAEFVISKRHDGYGVLGENGGRDTSLPLYKLDSIKLFAKHDRIQHGNAAIPLKIITFEYDYELCPNVDNNDNTTAMVGGVNINALKGKLTLKKVYFINGNSTKGRLTPYQFQYGDPTHNPADPEKTDSLNKYNPHYNIEKYDRWGNYKNDDGALIKNFMYPYVNQDSASYKANVFAAAWSLTNVILPSGGLIKVDYESNDYAYVQDQRAMQMFKIVGTATDQSGSIVDGGSNLFAFNNRSRDIHSYINYLYFKIALPFTETNINTFRAHYLRGIRDLYFKCDIALSQHSPANEFVSGYVELDSNNCALDATHNFAYIKYKSEGLHDDGSGQQCNPVAKAGWQFTQTDYNSLVFPGSNPSTGYSSSAEAMDGLAGVFSTDIPIMVEGFNKYCQNGQYSSAIYPQSSWIRLLNPTLHKYGGGARVKKLTMTDSWNSMVTGAYGSEYGQTYDYQVYTPDNGWISSGVASYEPMIGNDENPFRLPIPYSVKHPLSTSAQLYQEGPYGESFFPAPRVVYSTVKVTNIKPVGTGTGIKRTGTGYTVYEFYTAKDFPVIINQTHIDTRIYQPLTIEFLFNLASTSNATVSQGYSVEVNDMAGKPKAVWQYAENQPEFSQGLSRVSTALSGVEYVYQTSTVNPKQLYNFVTVIDSAGHMLSQKQELGVDFDCVGDLRESSTTSTNDYAEANLDIFDLVAFIMVPSGYWTCSASGSVFRSAALTKVITKTGILQTTIYHDNGQSTKSVNEAWDKETGDVLLQKTYNEFGDSIYTFTYPAHWMQQYTGMDQASINEGVRLQDVTFDSHGAMGTTANSYTVSNYLVPGDQVFLYIQINDQDISVQGPLWVYFSNGHFFLITSDGVIFRPWPKTNFFDLKIMRSGRKNQAGTPVGKLVARNSLYVGNRLNFSNVVNASAVDFSQNWQTHCCGFIPLDLGDIGQSQEGVCSIINPFVRNVLGNWRPMRNYAFIGNRTSSGSQIIQQEGNFSNFTPFWSYDSIANQWSAATSSKKWQWATEVTKVSPFGYEIETRDTLGRYNSALYGYNNSLNIAVASNAKYQQIGYDGFEDYAYAKLIPDGTNPDFLESITQYPPHFGFFSPFANSISFLSKDTSHTGTYSIRVNPGQSQSFNRNLNIVSTTTYTDTVYRLKSGDCVNEFSPNDSGKYVVSAWVKVSGWDDSASYTNPSVAVTIQKTGKANATTTLKPSGNIIEGWQRIEGTFYMLGGAKNIAVAFNADPSNKTYFDDLRIFPINASMKSFVYDPVDLRLKATLDENNYATFYEYDEEGNIIRIKKETVNGIMTVQETRKHIQP